MKTQNKTLYTRRFNQLKRAIKSEYSNAEFSDTASLRWGPECCVVAHDGSLGFTIYFLNEFGDVEQSVSIVKTPYCSKSGLVGIHVRETDLHHLMDVIDTALKDNFESIYIESIGRVS